MSFYDRLKSILTIDLRNLAITNDKAWNPSLWSMQGSQSLSGEVVNEYTALTHAALYNGITLIATTIGALPLNLMQGNDGMKRIAQERKVHTVMHDSFNRYITAMAGRETLLAHALAWGNGYAEKVLNGYGEVIELWPITPNRVKPDMNNGELVYRIQMPSGEQIYLPRDRVLHVPGLGFDGFQGYSVVNMARKSLGLGMALETFGSLYFGQGTHPGVIVSHPGKLGTDGHTNLKNSLTQVYSGLGNSHRLMLLEEGMTLTNVGIPPNDSQFLETRVFQIAEVARWLNLPVHKLKEMSKSTNNNIEQEQLSFVVDSLTPWVVRLEQNYNMQLLTPYDRNFTGNGKYYFKHSLEGLLRGDAKSRGEFYRSLWGLGALSANDVRQYEDLNPIAGGDEHFVPLNMVPLSMVKELLLKQNEPKPVAKEDPPDTEEDTNDDDTVNA